MKQCCRVTRPGFQLVALAIAVAVGMCGKVSAADEVDEALSRAGKVWYDKYCAPCHGPGGAPGNAVASATKRPVDLRTYVKGHGGKFPAADWLAIIADTRPASVHAPVWDTIKQAQAGALEGDAAARGIVSAIARYVNSIQTQ